MIHNYIPYLKDLYIVFMSSSSYPAISWIDFTNFTTQCKMIDNNLQLSTVDRLFIATNVVMGTILPDFPERELARYEFYEILVRLAAAKYKDPGVTPTYSEALQKLITECVMPNNDVSVWTEYRKNKIWTLEVNDVLETNMDSIRKLYRHYFAPKKAYMSYADALNLVTKDTQIDLLEKEATQCYGLSKMTLLNELEKRAEYKKI